MSRGTPIDWDTVSSTLTDAQRQTVFELQALERLMQLHGEPGDKPRAADEAVPLPQWGQFALRDRIGAGRFGTVYRAWDPELEREVALKLLDVDGVGRAAYLREARHLARVRHPNVVHVYGAAEFDEVPGFWMELVEGRTLGHLVRESGPLTPDAALATADALCHALAAVHRAGLVHQDVKPQNVMRDRDGRLVLMDLGAGVVGSGRPRSGTPAYMAPELFHGAAASARSDIYSLAVLLFFVSTGELPIEGRTLEEVARSHANGTRRRLADVRAELPCAFSAAIEQALEPDPARRFASVEDFAPALRGGTA